MTTKLETVSLDDARRVIAAGEAKAREIGQPSNIAVVDAGGNLVAHIRMDGAWIGSVDISINKAFTGTRPSSRLPPRRSDRTGPTSDAASSRRGESRVYTRTP